MITVRRNLAEVGRWGTWKYCWAWMGGALEEMLAVLTVCHVGIDCYERSSRNLGFLEKEVRVGQVR